MINGLTRTVIGHFLDQLLPQIPVESEEDNTPIQTDEETVSSEYFECLNTPSAWSLK